MRVRWNDMIQALVLVRIGQDLGSDTKLARLLHDLVELLSLASSAFLFALVCTLSFFLAEPLTMH